MTIKELIKILQKKDQGQEVQFVVVEPDGTVVCMDISGNGHKLAQLMKLFEK